jgi:hypothetical protein
MALIAEHPNELVRDQYLMEVADRCRVPPDRLRSLGSAPPPGAKTAIPPPVRRQDVDPVALSGPELEALRLAVHRPEEVVGRLERVLFTHPLALAAFDCLWSATTLHDAIEGADPQTADLLQRLAVEETDADPDDVMIRLVSRAGQRTLVDLQSEMRQAPAEDFASYASTIAWLKMALEAMRDDDIAHRPSALEAEERLVGWIVAREESRSRGAVEDDG